MTFLAEVAQTEFDFTEAAVPVWVALVFIAAAVAAWAWVAWRLSQHRAPVDYHEHPPVPWGGPETALVYLILVSAILIGPNVALRMAGIDLKPQSDLPPEAELRVFLGLSVAELLAVACGIWFLKRRARASWADLGLDPRHALGDLAIGAVGFLAMTPPVNLLYVLLLGPDKEHLREHLHPLIKLAAEDPSLLWPLGLCGALVAPLVEEFFFRVVLQGWLERRERLASQERGLAPTLSPGVTPILISSILFALAHYGQWPAPVPLFLLALVLGYLYHQTHRLLPSLTLHLLFNSTTFLNLWWQITK